MGNHVSLCHSTIVAEKLGFDVTTRLQEAKIVWVNRAEELDRAKWTCVRESQAMKEREARREGGIGEKERKVAVKRPGSRGTRGQGPSAGEGGQDLGQAAPMLGHDLNSPVAMLGQSHINFRQAVSSSALGENKPPLIGRGGGAGWGEAGQSCVREGGPEGGQKIQNVCANSQKEQSTKMYPYSG